MDNPTGVDNKFTFTKSTLKNPAMPDFFMLKINLGLDLLFLLIDSLAGNVQKFNNKYAESNPTFIYGGDENEKDFSVNTVIIHMYNYNAFICY